MKLASTSRRDFLVGLGASAAVIAAPKLTLAAPTAVIAPSPFALKTYDRDLASRLDEVLWANCERWAWSHREERPGERAWTREACRSYTRHVVEFADDLQSAAWASIGLQTMTMPVGFVDVRDENDVPVIAWTHNVTSHSADPTAVGQAAAAVLVRALERQLVPGAEAQAIGVCLYMPPIAQQCSDRCVPDGCCSVIRAGVVTRHRQQGYVQR